MSDIFRKVFLAGLGAAWLSKEKVEELLGELIKKGEMAEKEKPKFLREMSQKAAEARKEFEKAFNQALAKALKKANLATKTEVEELKKKVEALAKKIEQ
ncbi:MAG: phasin family protein [Candidatus Edwardsbacteria bacterium]